MSSTASFIRNAEIFLQDSRHRNLSYLNDEFGRGFQHLLAQLMEQVGMFISSSEVSNLVNSSKNLDGSFRSVFHDATARRIEQALDLPMYCLDLPDWHFRSHLDYFWQYAARAAEDREWFDGLLRRLLAVPAHPPASVPTTRENRSVSSIDWTVILERLRRKQAGREVE
jgi:hypothetical protein